MNAFGFQQSLNFSWLDAALQSLVAIEEANVKRAVAASMSREIVAICRLNRQRVGRVERMLEEFGTYLRHEKKQEIFRLVAETLLFIQYNGVRMKCTQDPIVLLSGHLARTKEMPHG